MSINARTDENRDIFDQFPVQRLANNRHWYQVSRGHAEARGDFIHDAWEMMPDLSSLNFSRQEACGCARAHRPLRTREKAASDRTGQNPQSSDQRENFKTRQNSSPG